MGNQNKHPFKTQQLRLLLLINSKVKILNMLILFKELKVKNIAGTRSGFTAPAEPIENGSACLLA
ncbi:unnamed protein product [Trifolium pratense]|uniref:Uncharacterized protein n=1 Tax=Trifolium pratense TaxID=57577 RepID=A0ACB0KA17_TRIPR|nr:unnamed protein product [Trifolium pratense]